MAGICNFLAAFGSPMAMFGRLGERNGRNRRRRRRGFKSERMNPRAGLGKFGRPVECSVNSVCGKLLPPQSHRRIHPAIGKLGPVSIGADVERMQHLRKGRTRVIGKQEVSPFPVRRRLRRETPRPPAARSPDRLDRAPQRPRRTRQPCGTIHSTRSRQQETWRP